MFTHSNQPQTKVQVLHVVRKTSKEKNQAATASLLHQFPGLEPLDGAQMKRLSTLEELTRCRTPLPLLLLRCGADSASTRCPPSSREDTVERLLEAHYSLSKAR